MAESPWETPAYRRVMKARAEGDALIVRFGDGAEVSVDKRRLVPSTSEGVDWENIKVERFEIIVPTAKGALEIPWTAIRALTDRAYSKHLVEEENEDDDVPHIGLRLKALREERGIALATVAEKVGISPESLNLLERGRQHVIATTLNRILAALGASMDDLVSPEPAVPFVPLSRLTPKRDQ